MYPYDECIEQYYQLEINHAKMYAWNLSKLVVVVIVIKIKK